jgi:Spx/MgsR family transcriptional regulator
MSIQYNPSATTMYGIKNCDTIKKARLWLSQQEVNFDFHDYRSDGLDLQWLQQVEAWLGWEAMLNKKGTTFRQLSDADKENIDKDSALQLMLEHPAMIKRPLLIHQGGHYLGFKASQYQEIFL